MKKNIRTKAALVQSLLCAILITSCSTTDDSESLPNPEPLNALVLTEFTDTTTQFDYLVLSPDELIPAALELCSYRNNDTLDDVSNATVIPVSTLLDMFGSDTLSAIDNLLLHNPLTSDSYSSTWSNKLKYVVILGDVILDSKQVGIPSGDSLVTSIHPKSPIYHNRFISPSESSDLSFIVARIPIRNNNEMNLYIVKMKEYQNNSQKSAFVALDNEVRPSFPEWMNLNGYEYKFPNIIVNISKTRSNEFWEIPFREEVSRLSETLADAGWSISEYNTESYCTNYDSLYNETVNIGEKLSDSDIDIGEDIFITDWKRARTDFFTKANQNHSLQIFYGHASPEHFTSEQVYSYYDTSEFTTPSVVLHLGCESGSFTSDSSMTRKLLFSSKGGPVAFIGAPVTNYFGPGTRYLNDLVDDIVSTPNQTIGEYFVLQGKPGLFILLGDPAIQMNY